MKLKKPGHRTLLMVALLLLTSVAMAAAADLYALGAKVVILAEPKLGAARVAEAKRGDLLNGSEEQKGWYHVTFAGKSGWVSRLLLGTKPPTAVVSVLDDNSDDELEGGARRRASNFTTAAAARGLSEERARLNQKFMVDYSGLAWMERNKVTQDEAIAFVERKEKR
jgi:hypothetical protein